MTAAFCARVTQVASLTREDVDFERNQVWFRPFKRHPGTWKTMVPSVRRQMDAWLADGVRAKPVVRRAGRRGTEVVERAWRFPAAGLLFPAKRGHSKRPHLSKDVVSAAIRRAAPAFLEQYAGKWPELAEGNRIRSHSGRRHAVSWMWLHDVPPAVGMAWAQIVSERVYKGYVELGHRSVGLRLARADSEWPM
eukprot:9215365-Lingulodinium_polyedra.AAC.1